MTTAGRMSTQVDTPHVQVLLATFNGAPWIEQQVSSIFGQQDVVVAIVASDDKSNDGTLQLLQSLQLGSLEVLPSAECRLGSAHRNFLRLIRHTNIGDADYVALSDQDDIWLPGKLSRGIACLQLHAAKGYSSNVTAFWPNGVRQLINKAQPQRRHDHLFGSPGPGCTFLLPREVFIELQKFVTANFERLQTIWVHDWLIYAFVRIQYGRWHIDDEATMLYRQHGSNEIGANRGFRAALNRLRRVRSGAYRQDILAIADLLGVTADVVEALRRLAFRDRLRLVLSARECRRGPSDCLAIGLFFLLMPRD